MPLIYQHDQSGQVVRINLPGTAQHGLVTVWGGDSIANRQEFGGSQLIINGVTHSQSVLHQFTRSLGADTYLYVFGDDMSDTQISGIIFNRVVDVNCRPVGSANAGIKEFMDFFNRNKASAVKNGVSPQVSVQIGRVKRIKGYLIASTLAASDPETMTTRFSLALKTNPESGDVTR
jgi:hypothetical protein